MLRRLTDRVYARFGSDGVRVESWRGLRQPVRVHSVDIRSPQPPGAIADLAENFDAALASLAARGVSLRGVRCDLRIDDAWVVYDRIDADLRSQPPATADGIVQASLADIGGTGADTLTVRWRPQSDGSAFAAGLARDGLGAIERALRRHGLRRGRIESALTQALASVDPTTRGVLAVAGGSGAQFALVDRGVVTALAFVPGPAAGAALEAHARGLARRAGVDDTQPVARWLVTDEAAPGAEIESPGWSRRRLTVGRPPAAAVAQRWLRRLRRGAAARGGLDFGPARPPALGWAALALGAFACAVAGWQLVVAIQQRAAAAATVADATERIARAAPTGADSKLDPLAARQAKAAAAVAGELQVPWPSLLATLEGVAGRDVTLHAVEPSATRQIVRITAEARSPAAMFDYLEALRARGIAEVMLVSHRSVAGGLRFQAEGRWGAS